MSSNANSYGFDFLKSQHVLSNNNDILSSTQQIDSTITNDTVSSSSNVVLLSMDDDSIRQREYLAQSKPDLEKQYDILAFLQKHTRGNHNNNNNNLDRYYDTNNAQHNKNQHQHCLPPEIIYRATGINLQTDISVANMIQKNPKIIIEYIPDPENPNLLIPHYGYQAKYPNIIDRISLVSQINRMGDTGIPMMKDLYDCYNTIEYDIQQCIVAGDIIAIQNTEDRDKILFPRGDMFLVELDGIISLPESYYTQQQHNNTITSNGEQSSTNNNNNSSSSAAKTTKQNGNDEDNKNNNTKLLNGGSMKNMEIPQYMIETDIDPTRQIRRGEAIQVGGQWFRISSAVKEGVPLSEQPIRAQAPLSVVSFHDLSTRNDVDGYIRKFTSTQIPMDDTLSTHTQDNLYKAKVAREQLSKLAHSTGSSFGSRHNATTNNIISQLVSSYAHASNPTTLAASLSSASNHHTTNNSSSTNHSTSYHRKRPHPSTSISTNSNQQATTSTTTSSTKMELEKAALDPSLALYNHARRHGCTKDLREMYFDTKKYVPESDHELQKLLVEYKLLEPNEPIRRPRLVVKMNGSNNNVDNDGKKKKRRYYERKNQRMTNTHLEGTEIGALLALAAEKQKQGQSVGDGGM